MEPDKVAKLPVGFEPLPLVTVKDALSDVETLPEADVSVLLTEVMEPFTPLTDIVAPAGDSVTSVVLEEEIEKVCLIKGSGVNLRDFTNLEEPTGIPVVCFAARLLRDKGVNEYFLAAKLIKERGINAKFLIVGDLDSKNPSGLDLKDLKKLKSQKIVKFLGYINDIPKLYSRSNIICLPSYREGLPKSLVEAAAASRAVVTTDVAGCKDAIIPNKTGILVPVRDHKKLANALQWLIQNPQKRISMGKEGRKFAEKYSRDFKFCVILGKSFLRSSGTTLSLNVSTPAFIHLIINVKARSSGAKSKERWQTIGPESISRSIKCQVIP